MKKRSTEIMQSLLKNSNEGISIHKLINQYRISEKTLKNDIQEIMDFIRACGMQDAIVFDGHKLCLTIKENIRKLMDAIYSMDMYHYKTSLEERKIYIIITLLYYQGYYSMQQLADELYVVRNTIVYDCKVVDEYVKKYDISFVAQSKKGIKIAGEDDKIESLLIDIFYSLMPTIKYEKTFFVQFIVKKTRFIYTLTDIIYHMSCFTKESNIIFEKEVFNEIAVCIFVVMNRMQQAESSKNEERVSSEGLPLDAIGDMISYVAKELGYDSIEMWEIAAIEKAILLRGLYPQIHSINDFELYGIICRFIFEISGELEINMQSDNLLIESLISHVKSMDNWNDAEFDMLDEFEAFDEFFAIRAIAKDKFYILEKYLSYKLSSWMKDSIVIHICGALLRNRKNMMPCTVIISCPGSMATSKYVEAQVKNYFNFNVADIVTTKQVEAVSGYFEGVDFIISTVMIPDTILQVIVVNPLLTIEDINIIQGLAFRRKQKSFVASEQYPLLEKMRAVYETGNTEKITYLNRELEKLLEDVYFAEDEIRGDSALLNMLKLKYIKIVHGKLEWKQAMQSASEDLKKDGYFDGKYVEEAIENVEKYGNYIIVNKGIALAHARKKAGVYEDGISLLVAKDGIYFDEDEIVNLLFFFSQRGEANYLDLFKEIIALGDNQENIRKLTELDSNLDVYEMISKILAV